MSKIYQSPQSPWHKQLWLCLSTKPWSLFLSSPRKPAASRWRPRSGWNKNNEISDIWRELPRLSTLRFRSDLGHSRGIPRKRVQQSLCMSESVGEPRPWNQRWLTLTEESWSGLTESVERKRSQKRNTNRSMKMTNTNAKNTNTNTKNTNMIKRPGRGPMWKWGLIRVQHRLEPKARKPRSQPWQQRITKWILRDNDQLSCDSELAFFSWPDTPMTGMLPCLVLSAAIIAMSGKPEVSSFFTVVFTFLKK